MSLTSKIKAQAEDPKNYWQRLKRAACDCYDKWQIDITLGGGIEQREYETGQQTAPFGEFKVTMPLYSTKTRTGLQERKAQYLEHGAQILMTYTHARARLELLTEKAEVAKQSLVQEGMQGIDAYFQIKQDAAQAAAERDAARRTLEAYINQCIE